MLGKTIKKLISGGAVKIIKLNEKMKLESTKKEKSRKKKLKKKKT